VDMLQTKLREIDGVTGEVTPHAAR
jgi:hypothetical protein